MDGKDSDVKSLYWEAKYFRDFYDMIHTAGHDDNFEIDVQNSTDKSSPIYEEPEVLVDTKPGKTIRKDLVTNDYFQAKNYTIGGFSAVYPEGNFATNIAEKKDYTVVYDKLKNGIEKVKDIKQSDCLCETDAQKKVWSLFNDARTDAQNLFKTLQRNSMNKTEYDNAKLTLNRLADCLSRLRKKDGSTYSGITKEEDHDGIGNQTTVYSFIKRVEILEYADTEGKQYIGKLTNDYTQKYGDFWIINNGQLIMNKVPEYNTNGHMFETHATKTVNLPKSGDRFFINFSPNVDGVKSIRVKIYITYLESCSVDASLYNGYREGHKWVHYEEDEDVPPAERTHGWWECCQIGESENYYKTRDWWQEFFTGGDSQGMVAYCKNSSTCTIADEDDRHPNNKYETTSSWEKGVTSSQGINSEINWKTTTLLNEYSEPVDITMHIKGKIFVDGHNTNQKYPEGSDNYDYGNVQNNGLMDPVVRGDKNIDGLGITDIWLYEYSDSDPDGKLKDIKLCNWSGEYYFTELDCLKKYYIRFAYNGQIYENTTAKPSQNLHYNSDNWNIANNAWEEENGTDSQQQRTTFNNRFAEIASYSGNYKIPSSHMNFFNIGEYNKVYRQEEIVEIFQEISKKLVEVHNDTGWQNRTNLLNEACIRVASSLPGGMTEENMRKVQFAADCRIYSYTRRNKVSVKDSYDDKYGANTPTLSYPVYERFTTNLGQMRKFGEESWGIQRIFRPIYDAQDHVNCGIKKRPNVDLALTETLDEISVDINGKSETYSYGENRRKFYEGMSDKDWTIGLNWKYSLTRENWEDLKKEAREEFFALKNFDNYPLTRTVAEDYNEFHIRQEDYFNGEGTNYMKDYTKGQDEGFVNPSGYELDETTTEKTGEETNRRLTVTLKYKIDISNQSYKFAKETENTADSTKGNIAEITEIVDYYDKNLTFIDATIYQVDDKGNKVGNSPTIGVKRDVAVHPEQDKNLIESLYYGREDTMGGIAYPTKTSEFKNDDKYKTLYLKPSKQLLVGKQDRVLELTFKLETTEKDAGNILKEYLYTEDTEGNPVAGELVIENFAEINGYKTYASIEDAEKNNVVSGLIDKDACAGNFDLRNVNKFSDVTLNKNTKENIYNKMYEDDTCSSELKITNLTSRTLEGLVFEDTTNDGNKITIKTGEDRKGDNKNITGDKGIAGAKVELIEIREGTMFVRGTSYTNADGHFGFAAYVPGDYILRYTFGGDDRTALVSGYYYFSDGNTYKGNTVEGTGWNKTSYNGQDYESVKFRDGNNCDYKESVSTDNVLKEFLLNTAYENSYNTTKIMQLNEGYWYDEANKGWSDAKEYEDRTKDIQKYIKEKYGVSINNHKAEVFGVYDKIQPEHIDVYKWINLKEELEKETFRFAYTPKMVCEIEYKQTNSMGTKFKNDSNQEPTEYKYKIENIDFGVVERPREELVIDQRVSNVKVISADNSTVLFDTNRGETNLHNLQWMQGNPFGTLKGNLSNYRNYYGTLNKKGTDKWDWNSNYNETIPITLDEELISNATIEVTYEFIIENTSENTGNTQAINILDYVSNNFTFDKDDLDNSKYWEIVPTVDEIQNDENSSLINNSKKSSGVKWIDLSSQQVILKAKADNPLKTSLKPGESKTATLKLKKVMSPESNTDDLRYTNLIEIVEYDNDIGRYDRGAVPGNQDIDFNPVEHDAAGASQYTSIELSSDIDDEDPTPPPPPPSYDDDRDNDDSDNDDSDNDDDTGRPINPNNPGGTPTDPNDPNKIEPNNPGGYPGTYQDPNKPIEPSNPGGNPSHPIEPNNPGNTGDGVITVIPPFGSKHFYYVLTITVTTILATGIYLIKKKVLDKDDKQ